MSESNVRRMAYLVMLSLIGLALFGPAIAAQSVKVEGLIKARNGDTMIVQASGSPSLTVLLTDSTQVGQVQVCSRHAGSKCRWRRSFPGSPLK